MSQAVKTVGRMHLDGLIEGRLPAEAKARERLRGWVDFARSLKLDFSLEIDGGGFSILASNASFDASRLGGEPTEVVEQAIGQLLEVFEPEERRTVFSTLRSVLYREGEEIQTVYAVGPDGVDVQERSVDADTVAAPEPLSVRTKVLLGLGGLAVAGLALLISSFFVDYQALWTRFVSPIDPGSIAVDSEAYGEYFSVTDKEADGRGPTLILTLERKDDFPTELAQIEEQLKQTPELKKRLALEALARGWLRVELFGKDDRFLGKYDLRIQPLMEDEKIKVAIPLPKRTTPERVRFGY